MDSPYDYALTSGIAEQSAYPWTGKTGNCQRSSIPPSYYLNDFSIYITNGSETMQKFLLTKYGPIGVIVCKDF